MPPLITTCAFPVRFYECDAYGHVNNTHYLRYMQEAAGQSRLKGDQRENPVAAGLVLAEQLAPPAHAPIKGAATAGF